MPSPPGDLPDPGTEPKSLVSPELAGRFFTTSATTVMVANYLECFLWLQSCSKHSACTSSQS